MSVYMCCLCLETNLGFLPHDITCLVYLDRISDGSETCLICWACWLLSEHWGSSCLCWVYKYAPLCPSFYYLFIIHTVFLEFLRVCKVFLTQETCILSLWLLKTCHCVWFECDEQLAVLWYLWLVSLNDIINFLKIKFIDWEMRL